MRINEIRCQKNANKKELKQMQIIQMIKFMVWEFWNLIMRQKSASKTISGEDCNGKGINWSEIHIYYPLI